MKMYLAMEEWFHDINDKAEVINARRTIASVLALLKKYFPRNGDNTNGYKLPKMHGATKMQTYIRLLGSGLNFFGGPGEAAISMLRDIETHKSEQKKVKILRRNRWKWMPTKHTISEVGHIVNPLRI